MRPTFFLKACAAALLALGLTTAALAQDAEREAAEKRGARPRTINVKPFEDIAQKGEEMFRRGELDLSRDVELEATAELNADGSLKPETVVVQGSSGDARLLELGQPLISAISQSKVLAFLDGAKSVRLTLKLDRQTLRVAVAADLESEDRAMQLAEGYGLLLQTARRVKQGTEEGKLYDGLSVATQGRRFQISFEMPKEDAGRMIAEMFARKRRRAAESQQ